MGGRGAYYYEYGGKSHRYGDEYTTVYSSGNIKFVMINEGSTSAPNFTLTKGRVYVTLNADEQLKYITYYDKDGKKAKQIDMSGKPHKTKKKVYDIPHMHTDNDHTIDENTRNLSPKEKEMVERVKKLWYNYIRYG